MRTINFVARSDNELLQFASQLGEVWIDSISVSGTADSFLLPEESMDIIQGERAFGEWRLEVTDTRTGAVVPDPELISWKLNLGFAEPVVYGEHLFSGMSYPANTNQWQRPSIVPGRLFTNQIHYFVVDTCSDTTELRVTLTGITNVGHLELWADHTGFPTFDEQRDDFAMIRNFENAQTGNGTAELLLTTTSPAAAPLRPGKPLFLAVRNNLRNQTNSYTLRVTLDAADCVVPPEPPEIESSMSISSTLPEGESGESEGELFSITTTSETSALSLSLTADGSASFVVQKDAPPTRDSFSYQGNLAGPGTQGVTLTPGSDLPLSPGKWYIRILNDADEPIYYSLTATAGDDTPVLTATLADGALLVEWNAVPGATYQVESSTNLENWYPVATVEASAGVASHSVDLGSSGEMAFFRVVRVE